MKRHLKKLCFAAAAASFLYWQNNFITESTYIIKNEKIPSYFDGMRIVQISDLQDAVFGKNNSTLIKKIEKQKPSIIVITGDIIDCHRTDFLAAARFAAEAAEICPVYYVCGNHEGVTGKYDTLKKMLISAGVEVLDNRWVYIDSEKKVRITGVVDPYFKPKEDVGEFLERAMEQDRECFNIVLCHRPELFETYIKSGADLTFCGHAHGGQIRLPFIGGLFAPHQGLFPRYTSGVYSKNGKSMVVSRGLGNSTFPFRIFNRPEIVVSVLKSGRE